MKNLIVVLSGPSGAGKGSVYKEISKRRNVSKYVSATTRKPREGEINGVDYDFITVEEFTFLKQSSMQIIIMELQDLILKLKMEIFSLT